MIDLIAFVGCYVLPVAMTVILAYGIRYELRGDAARDFAKATAND